MLKLLDLMLYQGAVIFRPFLFPKTPNDDDDR